MLFKDQKSIHLEKFLEFPEKFKNQKLSEKWSELIKIRDICNISIEEKRASKEIGSSLEADLKIKMSQKLKNLTEKTDFSEICITSSALLLNDNNLENEIEVTSSKAVGKKCPVCWKIRENACERHSNCHLS